MAGDLPTTNGTHDTKSNGDGASSFAVKAGLARMLKGGVIMDVVNDEQVCPFSPHSHLSPPPSHHLLPPLHKLTPSPGPHS